MQGSEDCSGFSLFRRPTRGLRRGVCLRQTRFGSVQRTNDHFVSGFVAPKTVPSVDATLSFSRGEFAILAKLLTKIFLRLGRLNDGSWRIGTVCWRCLGVLGKRTVGSSVTLLLEWGFLRLVMVVLMA